MKKNWPYIVLLIVAYAADQWTKMWALGALSAPGVKIKNVAHAAGPDLPAPSGEHIQVLGDWFRFTLAYNPGSAFSMRPGQLVPFLSPTVFYAIITVLAIGGIYWFMLRKLPKNDHLSRTGIWLIIAGALGNMTDRLHLDVVVDFLDSEFPDIFGMQRWPIFNLADSWVCIGVALVVLGPWLVAKIQGLRKPQAEHASGQAE